MINVQLPAIPSAPPRSTEPNAPVASPVVAANRETHLPPRQPATVAPRLLSRPRRDLQNASSAPEPRKAAIRQFADALVEKGDQQLAIGVANSLIGQRLASETRRSSAAQDQVAVPPHSTFGRAWAELADALQSEPFKSFVEAKLIDTSKLTIGQQGELTERGSDGGVARYFAPSDPAWSAVSATVLAAAKKLTGGRLGEVSFTDRNHAPTRNVAKFYAVQLGSIDSNDTLASIGQLFRDGTFRALTSADPLDAPVKQRQLEARQHLADLPPQPLSKILATFTPSTAAHKVQEADRVLAQLCSQGLMKLVPEAGEYDYPVMLEAIPEYSTFNLARKNLLKALTASTFTTFARENNLDPTSVLINPVSGELTGKVKGVNTTFILNDVSGWDDAWSEIQGAVQQMAAGSGAEVKYPTRASAPLYEVMEFYNEALPHQQETQQQGWEQRQLVSTLGRMAEITQNNGFKALIDTKTDDSDSKAVRARQQAVTQQLSGAPLTPSPLEALAAAVPASANVPVNTGQPRTDSVASAEHALAVSVHQIMLELQANPSSAPSKRLASIPANSLFGQWKAYARKAVNARGLVEHMQKNNLLLDGAVWIPPKDQAERYSREAAFAKENPEYFDAMAHGDTALGPFSRDKPIALNDVNSDSVPFEWVANFYGISTDPSSAEFARQTELMGRTQQFPKAPEHPQKIVNWLSRQRTAVGDSNDRYALIKQLKNGTLSNDDTTRFVVDPDSSHQPKGVTTVQKFLANQNWYGATSAAETANLLKALQTPVPQSPALGNHWGFLSTDIPLSAEQRTALVECVKRSVGSHGSLLNYLNAGVANLSKDPALALEQLLSSNSALELATQLETEMQGAPTATSLKQWLLTALVLELDPTAGSQHKTVAGVDLMGAANSGYSSDVIRERFNHYLTGEKGIPAHLAPAASRVLMAGMAPQLLVSDVPKTVTLGSPQWFSFTTAVNRIEWTAPGATANMTYQQVMNHHNIQPISDFEAQIQSYAQMDPLLDWAAINNGVDKGNYTLDQLKQSQQKLQTQQQASADSRNWLATHEAPNRRAMTLKVLRETFGSDIDYESRYMWERMWGVFSGSHYSLAEIYEAGRLDEDWGQEGTHVDFESLRKKAKDLPVINTEFDTAINADFNLRRHHTLTLFEDMLKKLPEEESKSLIYGQVEFLNVDSEAKDAGRGMVITSVYNKVRRDFAVCPAWGQIVRIADIDPTTPLGKKVSLEIDAQAFKNATEPKKGVKSDVILRTADQHILDDNNQHWPLKVSFPAHTENDRFSPHYASGRVSQLAKAMVDTTYLNQAQFINLHRNWTSNPLETAVEPSDFFKAVWHSLPGASSLEDLYHGEFFKAGVDLGIDVAIYLATEGLGKAWTLAKSGASWAATKVSAKFIEKFGAKEVTSTTIKDVTAASASTSLNALSRMQGRTLAQPTADMANGRVLRSGVKEQLTAVTQDSRWYAYDARTEEAYGPPQKGFRSDSSIALKRETLPNGSSVLIPERLLSDDALVIHRSTYSDVRVGNKVYRYDPKKPDVLTDLESADHFNNAQGLEPFCPAGPRAKREPDDVCFTTVVADLSGNTAKLVQGLQHARFYPSPAGAGKSSTLLFEHRIFDVVEKDGLQTTVQRELQEPIDYLETTRGTLVKDPHFGLTGSSTLANLEQNTRIVKLDAISSLSNDKRELRGSIALQQTASGGTDRYVVVEADTLTYYYSKFEADSTVLNFKKMGQPTSRLEAALVEKHIAETEHFLELAGASVNKELVALPTLDSALSKLEAAGYTPAQVNELKATIAPFTDEKKREFVYQLINKLDNSNGHIVLKSARLEPLNKTGNFASLPVEQQNKFYAEGAKESVDTQVKATGVGSQNKRSANDLNDLYRQDVADALVSWIQGIKVASPDYVNSVLKFGAGNCGEMAEATAQIIKKSGGSAEVWFVHGGDHAFTVVGGPPAAGKSTVNFAQAEWKDAWIVDPWADISCKASEYTGLFKKKMAEWSAKGETIYTHGDWRSPLYPKWITDLTTLEKKPLNA